jgi:hypothetical protein
MKANEMSSTRRRFLSKAGAALSVPLTLSAASVAGAAGDDVAALKASLAKLEDERAIRDLLRTCARHLNNGAHQELAILFANPAAARIDANIRAIVLDDRGEQDTIAITSDRDTASAAIHCTIHTETAIGPDCTLVDMARQQGEGYLRASAPRVLAARFVRRHGVWRIDSMA